MLVQHIGCLKRAEPSRRDVGNAVCYRLAHCPEADLVLGFPPFNQPQALAHHFTGVLVASGRHQPGDQLRLVFREHDVAGGHDR